VNKIEFGDCRETMRRWKEQGIKAQTCVTSPPYYGLRDYGHEGQLGLEETPEQYIAAMVEVFRCVWDVLEEDGTLWLNIGDSYNGSGGQGTKPNIMSKEAAEGRGGKAIKVDGIKPKDLIGIPWMMAFALRADGWYLRQDIIWHKPNPMPESVTDRCTKAHEYIFLMSKSQKYYYDAEAIKEEANEDSGFAKQRAKGIDTWKYNNTSERIAQTGQTIEASTFGEIGKRNKRSVWTVTTKPYAGAHFAVFPSDLIEPCILAGAPVGGIVLDPFMGSGTTAQVAQNLGRQYIGCELNPDYCQLQNIRTAQQSFGFEA
jgi:DNA modification methylase